MKRDTGIYVILVIAVNVAVFLGARLIAQKQRYTVRTTDELTISCEDCPCIGSGKTEATEVIVFTDFELAQSRMMNQVLDSLVNMQDVAVQVCYKFRPIHSDRARQLRVRAALAAHMQGKFQAMRTLLDGKQFGGVQSDAEIRSLVFDCAKKLSLDMDAFERDINAPAVLALLSEAVKETRHYGIFDFPSLIFEKRLVRGVVPAGKLAYEIGMTRPGDDL